MASEDAKAARLRQAATLIRASIAKDVIAASLGVRCTPREDIFDAIRRAGKATNFAEAVRLVGVSFPPVGQYGWLELADWALAYETAEQSGFASTQMVPEK